MNWSTWPCATGLASVSSRDFPIKGQTQSGALDGARPVGSAPEPPLGAPPPPLPEERIKRTSALGLATDCGNPGHPCRDKWFSRERGAQETNEVGLHVTDTR